MKSQILTPQNSPERKLSKESISPEKHALKAKNFVFARNRSSKFQRQIKKTASFIQDSKADENLFVPKLKSKQLLREPKFFFSLQRKKVKIQKSEPSFDQIKLQNPEMKGSKTKALYTKLLFNRKESLKQIQKPQKHTFYRNNSVFDKINTCPDSELISKELTRKDKMVRNFSSYGSTQNQSEIKMNKRPNLYENISFLIRRKKQIKSKHTLSRINQSKHYLTEVVRSGDEEVK